MSENNRKLFKTPFSAEYWLLSLKEMKSVQVLVIAAMLTALRIAIKSAKIPIGPDLTVTFGFVVNALGSVIYGPVMAAVTSAASDIIGNLLFPSGAFFFPFTLVEVLGGGMRERIDDDTLALLVGEGRAAVLSTEHPDALFTVNHAVTRNRLMLAMADAAFIFNTDGRRGESEALANRACDWIYAWEDYAGNRPLIARGARPFRQLSDADFDAMSRHWISSRAEQLNIFDLL